MTDGSNLVLRRLDAADYHKGFLQLLGQLSVVGDVSEEQFQSRFSELSGNPDYYTVVIEVCQKPSHLCPLSRPRSVQDCCYGIAHS